MKIPERDPMEVAPEPARYQPMPTVQPEGFDSLARAGQEAGKAVNEIDEAAQKQQHEARAVDVANGLAQFGTRSSDALNGSPNNQTGVAPGATADQTSDAASPDTGFLGTRGQAAAGASSKTLDSLNKQRLDIAESFSDPETKRMFLARSAELQLENRKTIERHVSQQIEVSKMDAANNISDQAQRQVAANPVDDALATKWQSMAVGAVHALGHGRDFEDLHERQLQAKMSTARIDSLLTPDGAGVVSMAHIDKAQEILDMHRTVLGDQLKPLEQRINFARKGADKQGIENAADSVASGLVNQYTDALSGKVDEAKVLKDIETGVPSRVERDEVQKRVKDLFARSREIFDQNTKALVASGVSVYNASGSAAAMPAEIKQRLNSWPDPRGPELLKSLLAEDDRAEARQERRSRIRANDSTARREQRDIDTMAKNEWEDELNKDPNANLDLFLATHQDTSKVMRSAFAPMQSKAVNQVEKGLRAERNRFVQEATDGADGVIAAKAGSRQDKDAAALEEKDFRARAGLAYDNLLEEKKGTPPTEKEISTLKGRVLLEYMAAANAPGSKLPNAVPRNPDAAQRVGADIAKDLNAKTANPKTWTADQKKKAAETLKKNGLPVTDQNINTMLQKVQGQKNTLPQQAPPAPPSSLQQLDETGDEYGLDLTEPPPQNAKLDKLMRKVR